MRQELIDAYVRDLTNIINDSSAPEITKDELKRTIRTAAKELSHKSYEVKLSDNVHESFLENDKSLILLKSLVISLDSFAGTERNVITAQIIKYIEGLRFNLNNTYNELVKA